VSFALYAHALRAARPRQLARRATRPVRRRLVPRPVSSAAPVALDTNDELWRSDAFARPPVPPDGALRAFSLNYGDDVLEAARAGDVALARSLIDGWLEHSPARPGVPWHPYVASTRIANWVAAVSLEPSLASPRLGESLRRQLVYLGRNVEDDILGNHVIRNAKALVLGGLAVGDEDFAARGQRLLLRELPEQILADGGHYERSPAYHRLVLRDLLELRPFAPVESEIERMRMFAASSARPDGAPTLFNDGGLDIAPVLELPPPLPGLSVHRETGYVFLRAGRCWLAFDCGPPAPDFLPAHAHADALSFQLWVDGRPIVVDPGTSTYEPSPTRAYERGTEAHSTIAVDGDQFQIWGSFRSGPLPRVRLVRADARELVGEASLPSGIRFTRTLRLTSSELIVEDQVLGDGVRAIVSSLPLANGAPVRVASLSGDTELEARTSAERFGVAEPITAFVNKIRSQLPWEGGWTVAWDADKV
jgi:hypothetical protein